MNFWTSTKHGFRALTSKNPGNDIGPGFEALAADIDAVIATYTHGTLGARPLSSTEHPGVEGRFYWATDAAILYYDTGTSWLPFSKQPGELIFTHQSAAPATSYALPCEGQVFSPITYPALYTAIGTTNGGSSSNPLLPDYRGRAPVGAGAGTGLTARTLGERLGEETHMLTEAELASHTHPLAGETITNAWISETPFGGGKGAGNVIVDTGPDVTEAAGSGDAHNNMQPSSVCHVWIKT